MSVFIFHNKFHRSNHHTIAMSGFPDSASDPIASLEFPYLGIFHNNIYDKNGDFLSLDNSYNWKSSYETVTANALEWDKFRTTYNTVNSFSGGWMNNESLYTSISPISSKWVSFYATYIIESNKWNNNISSAVYSNRVQEYTAQKSFSATNLYPTNIGNIVWDLSSAQTAIYITNNTSSFSGFSGAQRGGLYDLLLVTDATCYSALSVHFNPDFFKFPQNTNSFTITGIHARKFRFLYDGEFLHGKHYLYDINAPDRNLYYAGEGISFFENNIPINPISLDFDESFLQDAGLTLNISGSDPYDSSNSINIQKSEYDEDFVFTFVSLSALSASPPFGAIGSDDRINVVLPNGDTIPAINHLSASNAIFLTRCDPYQSIQIFTRSYGYISELVVNDVEIKDFVFKSDGYQKNETGHIIIASPSYTDSRVQSVFIEFGESVPILPSLSSGISLWLDALDYSTVDFTTIGGNSYITALSSKISGSQIYFTSNATTSSYYNTLPKQSFNYNLSSTHYRNALLSNDELDFCTFTVFTPYTSSSNVEWIWANGNYGIFKLPNKYSVGIGTLLKYYEYEYGYDKLNRPLCVSTRYLSANSIRPPSQSVIINDSVGYLNVISLTADFVNSYTIIGGKDPYSGFSEFKLHELLLYRGYKNNIEVELINDYLLDKWKFL